nr:polysaccharide biosynthesis tyrosine autokinase [Deinobacterium chartae]
MQPPQTTTPPHEELDLRRIFGVLRRYSLLIVTVTLGAAAGTYVVSRQQTPTFEAVSSVVAVRNETGNNLISNTLVTAPPLPQGAVDEAVHSSTVVQDILSRLESTLQDPVLLNTVRADLQAELARNSFERIQVKARLDPQQAGIYEIRASGETPAVAKALANAAVASLLQWDTDRATQRVSKARISLQEQLSALDLRLNQLRGANSQLDRQSLLQARSDVLQSLAQVAVLEKAATGTLTLVAEAVEPAQPVAPKPLRNAVLAGLLALLLSIGAVLLADALRRRITSEDDLTVFGLPVLGRLPRISPRSLRSGLLNSTQTGLMYEMVGFLRVNLLSQIQSQGVRRFAISSSRPSEGKSSVTAVLAQGLAASGKRVLIIDADLHRPSQQKLWDLHSRGRPWRVLPGARKDAEPARSLAAAVLNPHGAQALAVSQNVDLLPAAGNHKRDISQIIEHPDFQSLLDRWSAAYDVVLIDTPPILALSDTLTVARRTDGILMVVESGQTSLPELERAVSNARTAGSHLLGFVFNKVSRTENAYYAYTYGYHDSDPRDFSGSTEAAPPTAPNLGRSGD